MLNSTWITSQQPDKLEFITPFASFMPLPGLCTWLGTWGRRRCQRRQRPPRWGWAYRTQGCTCHSTSASRARSNLNVNLQCFKLEVKVLMFRLTWLITRAFIVSRNCFRNFCVDCRFETFRAFVRNCLCFVTSFSKLYCINKILFCEKNEILRNWATKACRIATCSACSVASEVKVDVVGEVDGGSSGHQRTEAQLHRPAGTQAVPHVVHNIYKQLVQVYTLVKIQS